MLPLQLLTAITFETPSNPALPFPFGSLGDTFTSIIWSFRSGIDFLTAERQSSRIYSMQWALLKRFRSISLLDLSNSLPLWWVEYLSLAASFPGGVWPPIPHQSFLLVLWAAPPNLNRAQRRQCSIHQRISHILDRFKDQILKRPSPRHPLPSYVHLNSLLPSKIQPTNNDDLTLHRTSI